MRKLFRSSAQAWLLGLFALCASPALLSCNKSNDDANNNASVKAAREHEDKYKIIDDSIIQDYLKRHKYTATSYQRTASGLYLVTLKAGTGAQVAAGNKVTVKYTGKFVRAADENKVFDTSDHPASGSTPASTSYTFTAGDINLIPGWTEGTLLMHKGDRKLLLVPSYLAYGPAGAINRNTNTYVIAPDTPILFDMEILTVVP